MLNGNTIENNQYRNAAFPLHIRLKLMISPSHQAQAFSSLSCPQYDERPEMFTRIFTLMLVLVDDKKISLYGHNIIL